MKYIILANVPQYYLVELPKELTPQKKVNSRSKQKESSGYKMISDKSKASHFSFSRATEIVDRELKASGYYSIIPLND